MIAESPRLLSPDGAPLDRITGIETEYAIDCLDDRGNLNNEGTEELLDIARRDRGTDEDRKGSSNNVQFAQGGNRQYIDNYHPEYATAEDASFLGTVHRVLRGHVATTRYFRQLLAHERLVEYNVADIRLIANTCAPRGTSWGSHRNYLASRALLPADYVDPLANHHASRIVWSGAGAIAINRHSDDTAVFTLSEKAPHIWEVANDKTTRSRPLVNLRDDPEADDDIYRRIHDVSGETIFNSFGNALTLAADSIMLRACEVGETFDGLHLADPVRAMKQISRDPSLKAAVERANGKSITGLELQMALAERAITAAQSQDYLTPEEQAWGQNWLQLLADLADDPSKCLNRVDWLVKRQLIENELARPCHEGLSAYDIAWNKAIDYHRLSPGEGAGMRMVRRGRYLDSPPESYIEAPASAPTTTRAVLRDRLMQQLTDKRAEFFIGWWGARVWVDKEIGAYRELSLDPYDTDLAKVDQFVNSLSVA